MSRWSLCPLLAVTVLLTAAFACRGQAFPDDPFADEPAAKPAKTASEKLEPKKAAPAAEIRTGEAAIGKALDEPTSLDFVEVPLQDVVDFLKEYHHIEIQLDMTSMDDVGIGTDTPVTIKLKGVSLRSALRLMLRQLKLAYTIQDDVLLITTPETAEASLTTRIYDVADLVVCNDDKFGRWDDYESLIETIVRTVEPTTWSTDGKPQTVHINSSRLGCGTATVLAGGPGTIAGKSLGTAKVLVVSQTYEVHREIADLLKQIRAVAAKHSGDGLPRRDRPDPRPVGGGPCGREQPPTGKAAQGQGPGVEKGNRLFIDERGATAVSR
jgi:hypothetical protein